MKRIKTIISIGICLLVAIAFSGCVGSTPGNQTPSPSPTQAAVQVGHIVVNESQNAATVYMNKSNLVTVRLAENPTTGFQWNLTTTPGLSIIKDEYLPSDSTGKLVGSGGTHIWDISAVTTGNQQIHAIYERSWEPTAGNETTFSITVVVS